MICKAGEPADFCLAEHDLSLGRLRGLMRRVEVDGDPLKFVEIVSSAFQKAQGAGESEPSPSSDPSVDLFRRAVKRACETQRPLNSILVLGCGPGFAGKNSKAAMREVRDTLPLMPMPRIEMLDVSPAMLRDDPGFAMAGVHAGQEHSYDLIASYSLLHFLPDIASFFRLTSWLLKPAGGLILSNEPNARYWKNAQLQASLVRLRQHRLRRTWIRQTARRIASLVQRSSSPSPVTLWKNVNQILQERHGFKSELTEGEIRRLVDVHRPEPLPGDFRMGLNGFDIDQLKDTYLNGFRLVWAATAHHLGYIPSSILAQRWRREEARLALANPMDGSVLTAYLTQQATG